MIFEGDSKTTKGLLGDADSKTTSGLILTEITIFKVKKSHLYGGITFEKVKHGKYKVNYDEIIKLPNLNLTELRTILSQTNITHFAIIKHKDIIKVKLLSSEEVEKIKINLL